MINYINERTGASITASYNSDYMEEGSSYDVNALLNKAIDGYTWIRYEGGQPAGSLNGDLVFNVYYNSNSTSNRGGGSGGGSSSGGHGSIVTSNGGPGVTIQEETVPLAELPTEALPQEPVSIPEDESLAALPKDRTECWKRDRAVCICYCVRRSRFLWKENKRKIKKKI